MYSFWNRIEEVEGCYSFGWAGLVLLRDEDGRQFGEPDARVRACGGKWKHYPGKLVRGFDPCDRRKGSRLPGVRSRGFSPVVPHGGRGTTRWLPKDRGPILPRIGRAPRCHRPSG